MKYHYQTFLGVTVYSLIFATFVDLEYDIPCVVLLVLYFLCCTSCVVLLVLYFLCCTSWSVVWYEDEGVLFVKSTNKTEVACLTEVRVDIDGDDGNGDEKGNDEEEEEVEEINDNLTIDDIQALKPVSIGVSVVISLCVFL